MRRHYSILLLYFANRLATSCAISLVQSLRYQSPNWYPRAPLVLLQLQAQVFHRNKCHLQTVRGQSHRFFAAYDKLVNCSLMQCYVYVYISI